ncbi:MAG: HYR domain-containing protein, partial [Saprospiraceae bacterium]
MKRKHLRFAQRMVFAMLLLMGMSFGLLTESLQAQTDLQVLSVTHTTSPLVPGDSETFVIEVRNDGILPAAGAIINFDIVDVDWVHDNASSPGPWTFLLNGTATRVGLMPGLTTESVTITVRVPSDASHQAINAPPMGPAWANISFAGVDTDSGNNEASTILTSRLEANLTIQKNLLIPQVAPGGTALYDITVCNSGPSDVAGIGVTDTPGANLDFGSLEMSPGSNSLYIPAQQCRTVSATATVSASAPVGANFGNTADINIAGLIQGPGVNGAPAITVGGSAVDNSGVVRDPLVPVDVEIVSVSLVGGGPLVPGTIRNFEVVARNNGPAAAYGATLTTKLFDVAFIPNNNNVPAGWLPQGSGGTWMHPGAWASGATTTFTVELIIPSDAHYQAGLPIDDFRAYIAAANPDPNTGNNSGVTFFDCQAQGNLTLNVQTLTSGVSPQGTAMYSVTICNSGPSDLGGLDVSLTLGAGFVPGSLVPSLNPNNIYVPAGQCVDIIVSGRVAAGTNVGSTVCLNAAVVANSANAGAGSTMPAQHNTPSDQSCALVQHPLAPADVEIVSMTLLGAGPFVPGTIREFEVVLRNNGPADAYGAVFNGQLFAPSTLDHYAASAVWQVGSTGGTFTRNAPWPSGTDETLVIGYSLDQDAHYTLKSYYDIQYFYASVSAANPDPNTGNNWNNMFFQSRAQANLTIEKTLFTPEVTPGGTALYEITVCNDGPSDIAGVGVNDLLGFNLTSVILSADASDLYIAAGQCKDILVSAQVNIAAAAGDDFCNAAEVDLTNLDQGSTTLPAQVNAPSTADVCGEVIFALPEVDMEVVSLSFPTTPMVPGTTETFTFSVRNNGPTYAYGATVLVDIVDVEWLVDNYLVPNDWYFFGDGVFKRNTVMAPGVEEFFTLVVNIPSDAYIRARPDNLGPIYVSASSSNPDPNVFNNTESLPFATQNIADLSVEKDLLNSEISPGETAIFNIVVNNAGPSDVDQVYLLDFLTGDATFQYWEPFNFNNFSFEVEAGDSKSVLVTVVVDDDGCGLVNNCAWVVNPGWNFDPNPGNNGPSCEGFTILDDVIPYIIACPADIEVDNDLGECGAVVNCDVQFGDNCDPDLTIEVIDGLACGSFFPVGSTEVVYKATDDEGNYILCEFIVTVNDTEQPTIECPRDIVIDINASGYATVTEGFANIYSQGPCGVTLTYEPPVADDNCDWIMTNYAGLGAIDNYTVQGFGSYFSAENWDISA